MKSAVVALTLAATVCAAQPSAKLLPAHAAVLDDAERTRINAQIVEVEGRRSTAVGLQVAGFSALGLGIPALLVEALGLAIANFCLFSCSARDNTPFHVAMGITGALTMAGLGTGIYGLSERNSAELELRVLRRKIEPPPKPKVVEPPPAPVTGDELPMQL